ncbi:hypothetical protein TRVA0_037S01486 [Trichomonascus vanleenenianus]|uniref:May24p n=1 Tax=Trichomonascus vanleenenianus TaxID=2268995 RepID=UPI003ECA1B65
MFSSLVVAGSNVPVGYTVPPFPSLYFPTENNKAYQLSFLYYTYDIWRFTLFWTLIFMLSFHMCAAGLAVIMHHKWLGGLWIITVYAVISGIEAIISGTIVGLMLSAVYKAGLFGVSTWIPFVWGLIQVIFLVISSYSMMSAVL